VPCIENRKRIACPTGVFVLPFRASLPHMHSITKECSAGHSKVCTHLFILLFIHTFNIQKKL
jgi:hypothetical protein